MADVDLDPSRAPSPAPGPTSVAAGGPEIDANGATVATEERRRPSDRMLVRAVARLPARVRTKLLVSYVGIVVLFVGVGMLGVRVLGDSNRRVEQLGHVQQRATAYRGLETQATQARTLLALRAGGQDAAVYTGSTGSARAERSFVSLDQTIDSTLAQLVTGTSADRLGFTPPASEAETVGLIRRDALAFSHVMDRITALDQDGKLGRGVDLQRSKAEPLGDELREASRELVDAAQLETDTLIAVNRDAFATSSRLFTGVALGAIVLAALLGFVLSRSLIGPLQRVENRVAGIASGDFSTHVVVDNRDELGSLATNVNLMNDELGRVYGELETVSRHKSEFLANMSHELRTPLNAIIGFSEVLHEQMFGELNEQQLGYVDDILTAGRHLLALINDILDLAKVEAGRMQLEISDVAVLETLRSGLTMHGDRAAQAGVTLDLDVEPADLVVPADERKVRQVVFNLLSNALKFTPAGGRVDVSARTMDGVVEVAVADTGTGIAPEDQELIFEEFGQASGADAATRAEGTGLGLPLSRRFIELHGGRLWVESVPGEGSTFRFTLPVTRDGVAA